MGFWDFLFGKKEDEDEKHGEIKRSINSLDDNFKKTAEWIKHLHSKDSHHESSISSLNEKLSTIEDDLSEIKQFISFFSPKLFKQSKHPQTRVYKQTAVQDVQTVVEGVQTPVQMIVQTEFLGNLSVMERAIMWVLLNTDMKLSYEDVSALLGKDRSTIRGQVNAIRQKQEGLIEEVIEKTGKKRIFIPQEVKEALLKTVKSRKVREKK